MSYKLWLEYLAKAEKQSIICGQVRKVSYKFPDGILMAEEYSMDTGIIQRRAWRKSKQLMGEPEWEIELGEIPRQINANKMAVADNIGDSAIGDFIVREIDAQPILSKRITKNNIEWRIRNLPYPIHIYSVKTVPNKHVLEVRTSNKKYYKEIPTFELKRCGLYPEQANISVHHQYSTLIITYRKPAKLCEMDAAVLLLLKDIPTEIEHIEEMLEEILTKSFKK